MAVILPHELYEQIIDELRFSFPDLKSCSLVCKAWLPRCRHHLYRVVRVGPRRVRGIEKERMPFFINKFQASFTRTFKLPEITSCVQGLSLEFRIRDINYSLPRLTPPPTHHSLPKGKAVIKPSISSIDLPFQPLKFLRTQWRLIDLLNEQANGMSDLELFEQVLDRSHSLEHLVIENYWNFNSRRDILRSIAVHAPKLKTLCLSEFRWHPSFHHKILEEIFDEWTDKFFSMNIPPLQLERLCLRNFSLKGTNLIQSVVLPSPCLNLHALRYLAISAKELNAALTGQFPGLGKEIIHLTITDLNTPKFRLRSTSFPKLGELQLFAEDEWLLSSFVTDLTSNWSPALSSLNFHINVESKRVSPHQGPGVLNTALVDILEESHVDPVLDAFIRKMSESFSSQMDKNNQSTFGLYISMDFIQADGSEMQQKCMRKVFPKSFATGHLHWRERRLLEWWFD